MIVTGELPSIVYGAGGFWVTAAVLFYDGNPYNTYFTIMGPWPSDNKYCNFASYGEEGLLQVGIPSAMVNPEVLGVGVQLTGVGFSGDYDIDAVICHFEDSGLFYGFTFYCENTLTLELRDVLDMLGMTYDQTVTSAFVSHGAGASYGFFNTDALLGTGVSLWGGDGANGERIIVIGGYSSGGGDD